MVLASFSSLKKVFLFMFFLVGMGFLMTVSFYGCQRADISTLPSLAITSSGVKLEAFLPEDAMVALKVGTADQNQLQKLQLLFADFPQADIQKLTEKFVTDLDHNIASYGMTYGTDVKPFIGDNPQFFMAIQLPPDFYSANIKENSKLSQLEVPLMTLALPLLDVSKADAFFQKLVEKGDYRKDKYKNEMVYLPVVAKDSMSDTNGNATFFSRVQDALIVTNTLDQLKASLDRFEAQSHTLLQNPRYQKAVVKIPSSLGVAYIDLKNFMGAFKKQIQTNQTSQGKELQKVFNQPESFAFQDAMESESFAVTAEEKGLRVQGWIFADEESMKKSHIDFSAFKELKAPYLYKEIPSGQAIFYGEGYNFKKAMEYNFKIWDATDAFKGIHAGARQIFGSIGLDFDRQILPMFDQGIGIVFKDNNGILPGFAFYTDVSSNVENASNVIEKFHTTLQKLINKFKPSLKELASAIVMEDVLVHDKLIHVVRLSLKKLPPEMTAAFSSGLLKSDPEFWYGILENKIAFMAFQSGFDKQYGGKTLAADVDFQTTQTTLAALQTADHTSQGDQPGFFYMSPGALMNYIDHFVAFVREKSLSSDFDQAGYDVLKSYVAPFKGAIFQVSYPSLYEGKIDGFILIQKSLSLGQTQQSTQTKQ